MRDRLGNLTIRNLIISYVLLYSIMPIVARLTSSYLTTYFYMAVVVVLVILILVLDRPENLNLYGTFLLPFVIYGVLTRFTSNADVILWGYQTLLFLLPVILGCYFTQDTSRLNSSYSKLIIFAIVTTMITTIIGCINNPNAARILATVNSSDAESIAFDMKNIGGYNFVYYMILLYPVLILAYKTKKIKLFPTILLALIIFITVIYSEYTTALLLLIITSFLFLTKRNLSAKGIIAISIISALFLLFFTDLVTDFLHWLADMIGSEAIAHRLDALAGGAAGLEASEDNRIELYRMSLSRFVEHPFFGTAFADADAYKVNGAHSFILDSLAQYGVIGGVCIFFMYKRVFTRFFLPYKDKPGFGYVVWIFIQAIILSLVNTGMWLEILCLFCPILFYWIYGTESNTEEVKDEDTVDRQHAAGTVGRAAVRKTE